MCIAGMRWVLKLNIEDFKQMCDWKQLKKNQLHSNYFSQQTCWNVCIDCTAFSTHAIEWISMKLILSVCEASIQYTYIYESHYLWWKMSCLPQPSHLYHPFAYLLNLSCSVISLLFPDAAVSHISISILNFKYKIHMSPYKCFRGIRRRESPDDHRQQPQQQ